MLFSLLLINKFFFENKFIFLLDHNSHHLGKTSRKLPLDQTDDNDIIINQENNINDLSDLD